MALMLGAGVDEAIRDHGRQTYPHECCGAMLGRDGVVAEAVGVTRGAGKVGI